MKLITRSEKKAKKLQNQIIGEIQAFLFNCKKIPRDTLRATRIARFNDLLAEINKDLQAKLKEIRSTEDEKVLQRHHLEIMKLLNMYRQKIQSVTLSRASF